MKAWVGHRLLALVALAWMFGGTARANAADDASPLPAPTGPHSVGRTHFDWNDTAREREIVVWVWYPAEARPNAERAAWLPGKWQGLAADLTSRTSAGASSVAALRTHAWTDAAPAKSKAPFPLLVFAPGMAMVPLQYASLIEDLASHGYVVAAVVPTGYSYSVISGERVVPGTKLSPPMLPPGLSPAQVAAKMAEEQARLAQVTSIWSGDMLFALAQMEKQNALASGLLGGRIDPQRVGVFGHSQGGASSLQVAAKDARVRAVADIDGMLPHELANGGTLAKPVLVLLSDTLKQGMPPGPPRAGAEVRQLDRFAGGPPPPAMVNLMDHSAVLRTAKPGYLLRLAGSNHLFSADLGVLQVEIKQDPQMPPGPGAPRMQSGPGSAESSLDAVRALRISSAYVRAFFDQYLRNVPSPLLNGASSQYPEVAFERLSD